MTFTHLKCELKNCIFLEKEIKDIWEHLDQCVQIYDERYVYDGATRRLHIVM